MLNIYQSFQTWIFLEHTNQTYSWYVSNTLLMTDYRNRTLLPSTQLQALHSMAPEPPWRLPSWSRIWPPTFWQQYSFPQTDFSSNPPPAPESQKFVTGCITPFKSTSIIVRTTPSVGYSSKFHPPFILIRKIPPFQIILGTWAGAPPTPYCEADIKLLHISSALPHLSLLSSIWRTSSCLSTSSIL